MGTSAGVGKFEVQLTNCSGLVWQMRVKTQGDPHKIVRFTFRSSSRYPHKILEENHFMLLSQEKPENSVLLMSGTQRKLIRA